MPRREIELSFSELTEERLDYILAELKKNRKAFDIFEELPPLIKRKSGRRDNSKEIGNNSEQRVASILSQHQLVEAVILQDQPGIDGIIKLDQNISLLPVVLLQVKTSERKIAEYYASKIYEQIRRQYGEPIVLRGSAPKSRIVETFENQLVEIGALTKVC